MEPFLDIHIQLNRNGFRLNIVHEIPSGIVGIYGPSGHGKTSMLNSIAGIVIPDEGRICIQGVVVFDSEKKVNAPVKKRNIGYVFQEDRLFPHLSVHKNLRYGQKENSGVEFTEVVNILKIGHLLSRRPEECSGGERQRIALGRVLLSSPKLILLDEPFSAVDNMLRESIIPYLVNINRKFDIPMLVVSHDLPDLLSLTDYLVLLNHGQVSASGLFRDLIADEQNVSLMQGSGIYNVFELSVADYNPLADIVILKSSVHNFTIQAIAKSFHEEVKPGTMVKVLIRPEDIAVSLSRVEGISLRNQVEGIVEKIFSRHGYSFCLVDAGEKLLVEITEASRKKMMLEPGRTIYCLFKSVALKIY